MNAFPPVLPYRCGHVCAHAVAPDRCQCPDGLGTPRPVMVDTARARGGACGPEAHHLVLRS